MEFCWHGAGAFSVRLEGFEFLVDPYFSPPGTYGEWYTPNRHAPPWDEFAARHRPAAVFITHGHFDHFDPEALKRLEGQFRPLFLGSRQAMAAVRALVGVEEARTLALEPGPAAQKRAVGAAGQPAGGAGPAGNAGQPQPQPVTAGPEPGPPVRVGPLELRAVAGVHWLTGEEGDRAAARLAGRPDRYGVMPCGGPMLGLVMEARGGSGTREGVAGWAPGPSLAGGGSPGGAAAGQRGLRVYISGDTEVAGVPRSEVDVAILNVCGSLLDPRTRAEAFPALTLDDLPAVAERVRPREIVAVHHDFEGFHRPVDLAALQALARRRKEPRVRLVACQEWVTVGG